MNRCDGVPVQMDPSSTVIPRSHRSPPGMRALLAALGAVLAFGGCATARYAEAWHTKPQLTGPAGNGRLATVEETLPRPMHEERAKPLAATTDCLEALQFAADELTRNRGITIAA